MNSDSTGKPPLALIAGPTASGKSALALALAEAAGGTVINADSAQVYRDLGIVSARPSAADEARVPHRLYGYRDGADSCSAADWAADAKAAIAEAHDEGRLPILVGGTGLYLRTLLEGIAPVPEIDPAVRKAVRALPVAEAHAALAREDPEAAARLRPSSRPGRQRRPAGSAVRCRCGRSCCCRRATGSTNAAISGLNKSFLMKGLKKFAHYWNEDCPPSPR
jgi:tRNA dimethylallyltransferase